MIDIWTPDNTTTAQDAFNFLENSCGCEACGQEPCVNATVCANCGGSQGLMPEVISLAMSNWEWDSNTIYLGPQQDFSQYPVNNSSDFRFNCDPTLFKMPETIALGQWIQSTLSAPMELREQAPPCYTGSNPCGRFAYFRSPNPGYMVAPDTALTGAFDSGQHIWTDIRVELTKSAGSFLLRVFVNFYNTQAADYDLENPPYNAMTPAQWCPIFTTDPGGGVYPHGDDECPVNSDAALQGGAVYTWSIPSGTDDCYETLNFDQANIVPLSTIPEGFAGGLQGWTHPTVVTGTISTTETPDPDNLCP